MQPRNEQQLPRGVSLASGSRAEAFNAKRVTQPRREKTSNDDRMSIKHSVFVLDKDGKPLTPTTPARARKLLVNLVGFEDVRFNHARHRWGKNFSTVEIGKTRIRAFFTSQGAKVFDYEGHETKEVREKYGYRKTRIKNADKFTAHCSDSLALAVDVAVGEAIEPGPFLVVNDTYRCKRRRLHDTQPAKGGMRAPYSKGKVFGLRKGLTIGLPNGKTGQLCGEYKGGYRYYFAPGKRGSAKRLAWISSNFNVRAAIPPPAEAGGPLAA